MQENAYLVNSVFQDRIAKLYAKREFRDPDFGLERIAAAAAKLGNPQKNLRCVHVTGTNGKGSTAKMIATILSRTMRVGLLTSPHLVSFRERIRINDELISEEEFVDLYDRIDSPELSFFEFNTLMGLLYFKEKNVDIAVIEVGMGGSFDATNIIHAEVAVITAIHIDHVKWLGNTRESIAKEKAGIIKKNATVFITEENKDLKNIFLKRCEESSLHWTGTAECSSLLGAYQRQNAGLAQAVCEHLGCSKEAIDWGLRNTTWPGRLQWVSDTLLLDGAHNAHAFMHLGKYLAGRSVVAVFGSAHGKDDIAFRNFVPCRKVFYTKSLIDIATPLEKFHGEGVRVEDYREALLQAHDALLPGEILLVTGSLYLVGNILALLEEQTIRMRLGLIAS